MLPRLDVDDVKTILLRGGLFHDQRAVQMLAALRREINPPRLQDRINAVKRSLCSLEAGPLADPLPNHLARRAADNENIAGLQICGLQQLLHGLPGLRSDLFIHRKASRNGLMRPLF